VLAVRTAIRLPGSKRPNPGACSTRGCIGRQSVPRLRRNREVARLRVEQKRERTVEDVRPRASDSRARLPSSTSTPNAAGLPMTSAATACSCGDANAVPVLLQNYEKCLGEQPCRVRLGRSHPASAPLRPARRWACSDGVNVKAGPVVSATCRSPARSAAEECALVQLVRSRRSPAVGPGEDSRGQRVGGGGSPWCWPVR
jgi:hypothetical protein